MPKILLALCGVVIVVGLIAQKNRTIVSNEKTAVVPTKSVSVAPTVVVTSTADPTVDWKTYTFSAEKASFKYPQDWIITKPAIQSNALGADQIGIQSPSGAIKISWVSALSGFGGACNSTDPLGSSNSSLHPCPLIMIIDMIPIKKTPALFVVTGIITQDGSVYQPFIAVQDNKGLLTTQRSMGYDMFIGKNNGSLPEMRGQNTNVLFSTGNAYAGGPPLTQTESNSWFAKPEVQQAKQILLSLTY